MDKTKHMFAKFAVGLLLFGGLAGAAQQKPLPSADASTPHRTRLILKDGSYQLVMSYRVVGDVVRYVSAERGGVEEEIPSSLVDFEATKRWEQKTSLECIQANQAASAASAPVTSASG